MALLNASMWAVLILLSVLAGLCQPRRLLLVAGTLVAVSGIAYYALMAAWFSALR